jgi:hypothetical protein
MKYYVVHKSIIYYGTLSIHVALAFYKLIGDPMKNCI